MVYQTTVIRSITEVEAGEWDKISQDTKTSHEFLKICEELKVMKGKVNYLILKKNGQLKSALAFYIKTDKDIDLTTIFSNKHLTLMKLLRIPVSPVMTIESPLTGRTFMIGRPNKEEINLMTNALENKAKELGCATINYQPILEQDNELRNSLDERNFSNCFVMHYSSLDLTGINSFEEYKRQKVIKKNRSQLNRDIRRFNESGIVIKNSKTKLMPHSVSAKLIKGVYTKYKSEPDVDARFLEAMEKRIPNLTWVGAFKNKKPIGFAVIMQNKNDLHNFRFGTDYNKIRDSGLHFTIVYYNTIREALKRGITSLNWGFGAVPTKKHRGADTQESFRFTKSLNPIGNLLLRYFFKRKDAYFRKNHI